MCVSARQRERDTIAKIKGWVHARERARERETIAKIKEGQQGNKCVKTGQFSPIGGVSK